MQLKKIKTPLKINLFVNFTEQRSPEWLDEHNWKHLCYSTVI